MEFEATNIQDLYIAKTKVFSDERGGFMRVFCKDDLNFPHEIKQINYSRTKEAGTVRGMHFQKAPSLESKIVRCVKGKIYDVAVDLRKNSKTFMQHFGIELSEENNLALMIPQGCAHGFQALTDDCEMIYIHSEAYNPEHEGGVKFDDPRLGILWPLEPKNLSDRDLGFELLNDNFKGLENAV